MGAIEIEGLRELNKAIRRSTDTELPKRIGQANKSIGQLVISKLEPASNPAAVGRGAGAAVRPSASKREVLLRVGGAHRAHESVPQPSRSKNRYALPQWGKQIVNPWQRAPDRPHILGTVEKHRKEIEKAYLDATQDAMSGAFAD